MTLPAGGLMVENTQRPLGEVSTVPSERRRLRPGKGELITEPYVHLLQAHTELNILARVGAGSFWYMRRQIADQPDLLVRCVDQASKTWRRNIVLAEGDESLDRAWNLFSGMAVVQVFSAFDLYITGTRAELDRWHASQSRSTSTGRCRAADDDQDELAVVDAMFRANGWPSITVAKYRASYRCFRLVRNCIVHRRGLASEKLAEVSVSEEHRKSMNAWPGTRAMSVFNLPSLNPNEPIALDPGHALLAGETCARIAGSMNSSLARTLGTSGMVHMAAYHGLLSPEPIPVPTVVHSPNGVVAYFLSNRYGMHATPRREIGRHLKEQRLSCDVAAAYRKLYENSKWRG
jgi:hypothetical protein